MTQRCMITSLPKQRIMLPIYHFFDVIHVSRQLVPAFLEAINTPGMLYQVDLTVLTPTPVISTLCRRLSLIIGVPVSRSHRFIPVCFFHTVHPVDGESSGQLRISAS